MLHRILGIEETVLENSTRVLPDQLFPQRRRGRQSHTQYASVTYFTALYRFTVQRADLPPCCTFEGSKKNKQFGNTENVCLIICKGKKKNLPRKQASFECFRREEELQSEKK